MIHHSHSTASVQPCQCDSSVSSCTCFLFCMFFIFLDVLLELVSFALFFSVHLVLFAAFLDSAPSSSDMMCFEITNLKQPESKCFAARSRTLDQAAEINIFYVTTLKALEFKLSTHTHTHTFKVHPSRHLIRNN